MSLKNCIDAAVAQGHITLEEGEALKKRYDTIAKQVLSTGEAKEALVKEIEIEAAERKRRAMLTETVRNRLTEELQKYRNLRGEVDYAEAFLMMHENFGRLGTYVQDAESIKEAIRRGAQGKLEDLLHEFRRGAITGDLRRQSAAVQSKMTNVVKELFGESTGDAQAKALADAWTAVAEDLRLRFNAAGGAVGKLDKWGLPQGHDMQALLDVGKAKWIERLMQRDVLDRDRMVHPLTGRKMSDDELREALSVSYDRITTDGLVDREPSGQPMGRGALWSQHADHRFIHFKNAEAWLAYARDFGNPDPFASMMGHINRMARDIAHMEKFGPNPTIMRNYLRQVVEKEAATRRDWGDVLADQVGEAKKLAGRLGQKVQDADGIIDQISAINREMAGLRRRRSARVLADLDELHARAAKLEEAFDVQKFTSPADQDTANALGKLFQEMRDPVVHSTTARKARGRADVLIERADAMWELQRGSLAPVNAGVANVMASTRNVISASSLGAALFSSISDAGFGQAARMRVGMGLAKANFGRLLVTVMKEMIPGMTRREAARAGLGLDSAIDFMHRKAKENQTVDGRGWSGFLADRTLTLGGLSPWTQAGKHRFGLDLMGSLADVADKPYAQLPPALQRALEIHGFDAASWDAVRVAPKHEPKDGVFYLRPNEIEAVAGKELSERYLAMILRETRYAVPETTVRSRSVVVGRMKPGSTVGEALRSMSQFKGFGIAVAQLYVMRLARELKAGDASAAREAAALVITSAFLGAIAMALKDVKDGRDPRKWFDENTYLDWQMWGAAMLQAGGLGIYGDFLFSNTGRHDKGLGGTLMGPMVDRADNLLGLTMGNVAQKFRGEKTNAGRELSKAIRQNTPMSNLWYTNLIWQRVLMDSLQRQIDPEAYAQFRRQIQTRQKDYRQEFWWRPGETRPSRAPNMSRVISTR